jgi:hypothetical protein
LRRPEVLFVTREHIHVDRIATAWAIRRFVDPDARFSFVPRSSEPPSDGVMFDMRGAELGHRGGRCTLDAVIEKYEIRYEGLLRMATVIRSIAVVDFDTAPDGEPSAPGLEPRAAAKGARSGGRHRQTRTKGAPT